MPYLRRNISNVVALIPISILVCYSGDKINLMWAKCAEHFLCMELGVGVKMGVKWCNAVLEEWVMIISLSPFHDH